MAKGMLTVPAKNPGLSVIQLVKQGRSDPSKSEVDYGRELGELLRARLPGGVLVGVLKQFVDDDAVRQFYDRWLVEEFEE